MIVGFHAYTIFSSAKLNGVEFVPGPPPVITISADVIPAKLSSVSTADIIAELMISPS